jgi:tRNA G18 (ribose-2'-O)-methylase SpoU
MKNLYFILHNLRSAYNVGSIFRTADGVGVAQIYLTGYTMTPYDQSRPYETKPERMLGKTALGADKSMSWEKHEDIAQLIAQLRGDGVQIVALEQTAQSIDYAKFVPNPNCSGVALILGNEPLGIDEEALALVDSIIEIPMHGEKKSLNVSVAAGVAGYQIAQVL